MNERNLVTKESSIKQKEMVDLLADLHFRVSYQSSSKVSAISSKSSYSKSIEKQAEWRQNESLIEK